MDSGLHDKKSVVTPLIWAEFLSSLRLVPGTCCLLVGAQNDHHSRRALNTEHDDDMSAGPKLSRAAGGSSHRRVVGRNVSGTAGG